MRKFHFIIIGIIINSMPSYGGGLEKYISDNFSPQYIGTCKTSNGDSVPLNEALFVKNLFVRQKQDEGYRLLSLVRDQVRIENFNKSGDKNTSLTLDVPTYLGSIQKNFKGLDVENTFIWVDGFLGIYWRETYQNKPHKHGVLVLLDNKRLLSYCSGIGGFYTSH